MSDLIIKNYIIKEPIDNILKTVKRELRNNKLRDIQPKGTEIRVTCPHHNDGLEKDPDCFINATTTGKLEYGYCHCFACGFSGRLSRFIGECFDEDEQFGEEWLISRFGANLMFENNTNFEAFDSIKNAKKEINTQDDESTKLHCEINKMQSYHPYMDKRKLSRKICELFEIKYDISSRCLVFPVYDENDKLYMLTRRSVEDKTFIIDKEKEKPVYLYNYIKNKNIKEVIVCESQINALTCFSWGYPAIALFGTGTKHQYDILNKSNIIHYCLAFDGDEAGKKGVARFLRNIKSNAFVDIYILPKGKDINDLTLEEFETLELISVDEWRRRYESNS